MFYKIILALALVGYVTESSSKSAISAQNFNRRDLPISNKLNLIQFYTTSKPGFGHIYEQIFEKVPANKPETINYGNIQYAPLDLKTDDQTIYQENKLNKKVTLPVGNNSNTFANSYLEDEQIKKNNIEPRIESESNNEQIQESVIYGHNIQVPQSGIAYPAYNILYRDDNEYTTKDNQNQANFVNPYLYYHKTEIQNEQTSLKPINAEVVDHRLGSSPLRAEQLYDVIAQQDNDKSDSKRSERVLSEKESPLIQPQLLHARPYRLHLNVARAYNIVHAPNIKARLINKVPSPSQALLHKSDSTQLLASSEKRTKLVSIQNKYFNRRI